MFSYSWQRSFIHRWDRFKSQSGLFSAGRGGSGRPAARATRTARLLHLACDRGQRNLCRKINQRLSSTRERRVGLSALICYRRDKKRGPAFLAPTRYRPEKGGKPGRPLALDHRLMVNRKLQNVTKRRKLRAVALHFESRRCGVDGY